MDKLDLIIGKERTLAGLRRKRRDEGPLNKMIDCWVEYLNSFHVMALMNPPVCGAMISSKTTPDGKTTGGLTFHGSGQNFNSIPTEQAAGLFENHLQTNSLGFM